MMQIQQRRKETENRIASEAKNIEEMQAEIRGCRLEEEQLKDRLQRISLRGVVGYPTLFYGIALVVAVSGIYVYPDRLNLASGDALPTVWVSLAAIIAGSLCLGRALLAIEQVARETEIVLPEGKFKVGVEPVAEMRPVSAYYLVDTAPGIQKLVVDWRRKVAYWFDSRIDNAVREGKISAYAIPSTNSIEWTNREKLTLVNRAPKPEELPL